MRTMNLFISEIWITSLSRAALFGGRRLYLDDMNTG